MGYLKVPFQCVKWSLMHFLALATLLIWMSPFPDSLVYSVWIAPRLAVSLDGQGGYTAQYAPRLGCQTSWSCLPGWRLADTPRLGTRLHHPHGQPWSPTLGSWGDETWELPACMERVGVAAYLLCVMSALGFCLWHCLCLSAVPSGSVQGHSCLVVVFPGERAQVYI